MGKKDKKSKQDKKSHKDSKSHKDKRRRDDEHSRAHSAIEKAQMKANETPEERNERRLAKKQKKQQKAAEEKELFGFTNEANPFGDPNLTKAFVWGKKYAKEAKSGHKRPSLTKHQLREKQFVLREEIDKVKVRKAEREVEVEQMEEMRAQVEREAMRDQLAGWEEKEEEFHRMQAKRRSEIRIKEGRETAIDILAKNVNLANDEAEADLEVELDVELTEPHKIFNGLGTRDLEDLRRDIKIYVELGQDLPYWNALMTVCDDEIGKSKHKSRTAFGLHESVQQDVAELFGGKSHRQLEKIEGDIDHKLDTKSAKTDVAYWEALKTQLQTFKAKAHLSEFHKALLKKRLKQLRAQHSRERKSHKHSDSDREEEGAGGAGGEEDWEPELLPHAAQDSDDGDLSPELGEDSDDGQGAAIDPEEDRRQLEAQRRVVAEQKEAELAGAAETATVGADSAAEHAAAVRAAGMNRFMQSSDQMYEKEAGKGMEEMDETFNEEFSDLTAPDKTYWWHDKYRPRKPRFFNRVKTGFDWNKYNQTHYDKENPPPKIVQGYKFNVFYPDLIDSSVPPKYYIEESPDSMDHCVMRFSAGAPYEDLAFKIVKKEWEYSHKHGFKCVFDRGVLHLYFNFKRYRYRR